MPRLLLPSAGTPFAGRLADQDIKKWSIVGGGFSKKTFEEIPADPSILIGFNYTSIQDNKYPGFIQPIFLTLHGEVLGKEYGDVKKGTEILKMKAKPGYAVGASTRVGAAASTPSSRSLCASPQRDWTSTTSTNLHKLAATAAAPEPSAATAILSSGYTEKLRIGVELPRSVW